MQVDDYTQSAEFYDLLSESHWHARRASFAAVLSEIEDARIVLDVGTGTGPYLRQIADALPSALIHAVEPSASMRVGLMSRVLADNDLRRRVTVHPSSFEEAMIPSQVDFSMVCGCIGFLDAASRARLWRRLADNLSPVGAVLADVMFVDKPQMIDETLAVSTEVGSYRYDVWLSGIPVSEDVMRWRMRFEQWNGDQPVRQFAIERNWHTFGLSQLIDEAASAGFHPQPLTDSPVPAVMLRLDVSH